MTVMEVVMKKNIIVILLCLLFSLSLIFTLSSCDNELPKDSSNTQSSNADDSSTSDDASTEQPPITDDTEGEDSSDVNNENGDVPPADSDSENNDGTTDNTPDDSQESSVEFSKGLEYSLSNDSTYYILIGIGSCTDSEIIIPPTYQSLPIKEIASYAFSDQKITSLTTSKNITTIGRCAFDGCTELKKITLSKDVFSIAFNAFSDCEKLDTIIVDAANPYYTVTNNVLFTKKGAVIEGTELKEKILVMYPLGSLNTSYTIPSDVSWIAPYAFVNCEKLESIEIPDNITRIGDYAFYGCLSLYDISTSSSIQYIGEEAFDNTGFYNDTLNWRKGLLYVGNYLVAVNSSQVSESCAIKDGTLVISDNAFEGCTKISSLSLPSSLKYIGVSAFDDCDSLTSISIPNNVIEIGNGAFYGCDNLREINIGAAVKIIGNSSFSGCNELRQCVIPNMVEEIGDSVFDGCDNLLSVTIGNSVKVIGEDVFADCPKLIELCNNSTMDMTKLVMTSWWGDTTYYMDVSDIYVRSGESHIQFNANGFVTYSLDSDVLLLDYMGSESEIQIPDNVTEIAPYAFYYNTTITDVSFSSSVKTIGNNAFNGCSGLESLFIPESIDTIGDDAFYNCSALASISFEGDFAFDGNPFYNTAYYQNEENWDGGLFYIGTTLIDAKTGQTSFVIKDGTTAIADHAFNSTSVETVTIPSSVTSIGDYAFGYCESLISITIPDSVITIGEYAFVDCESLKTVTLGKGVRYIGQYAFRIWGSNVLKKVYIEDVESWCKIKFENLESNPLNKKAKLYIDDTSVSKLKIPNTITKVNEYAFYGLDCLSVYLPDTVTYIGEDAFGGYWSFGGSVYYSGDVADWCNIVFANETANPLSGRGYLHIYNRSDPIFELEIPAEVTEIKDYAFYHAAGIMSLNFEDGSVCSSIGDYAFWNASSLQVMRFAPSVKTVGAYAFDSCYGLQFANFNSGLATIGEYAFNDCNELTEVMCGQALRNVNENAFYGCIALETIYYYGGKTSWEKANVDGSNVELMLTPVYFYSEEKPTDTGNYWHYVDNSIAFWGTVTPGEIPPYVEHQTELYAEWFEKVFVESSGTYSEMLYSDLAQDQDYLDAITRWEWLHIATEPSHHMDSGMISKKDIYKLIIYDMLGGSSSYEDLANLYDTVDDEATSYMYKFLRKVSSASIVELEDLADYDTSDYTEQFKEVFGGIDKLDDILKHFDCLYDAVYACAQYQAFANMDEAFKNVLTAIYNDTENPTDLRNAALECIECYEAGVQNVLTIIADATIRNELKMLMGEMMDEVWTRVVYSIPGGAGVIIMEGARGIRALGDGLFNLDDRNEAFYQLEANVLLERAILRILPGLYNAYTQTFDEYEATTYMRAIDMYKCVAISGFDYCIQLLEVKASAVGTSKEDKEECNRLIDEIEAFKATKQSNFKRFEELTLQHYQRLYSTVNE